MCTSTHMTMPWLCLRGGRCPLSIPRNDLQRRMMIQWFNGSMICSSQEENLLTSVISVNHFRLTLWDAATNTLVGASTWTWPEFQHHFWSFQLKTCWNFCSFNFLPKVCPISFLPHLPTLPSTGVHTEVPTANPVRVQGQFLQVSDIALSRDTLAIHIFTTRWLLLCIPCFHY